MPLSFLLASYIQTYIYTQSKEQTRKQTTKESQKKRKSMLHRPTYIVGLKAIPVALGWSSLPPPVPSIDSNSLPFDHEWTGIIIIVVREMKIK